MDTRAFLYDGGFRRGACRSDDWRDAYGCGATSIEDGIARPRLK
jgi:hypothetical protein